jgi:hypothetical protein
MVTKELREELKEDWNISDMIQRRIVWIGLINLRKDALIQNVIVSLQMLGIRVINILL